MPFIGRESKVVIQNKMLEFIDKLNKVNGRKNIFYETTKYKKIPPLGKYVVDYIISHQQEIIEYINSTEEFQTKKFIRKVVEYSTDKIIATLFNLNQYAEINDEIINKINALYYNFVNEVFNKLRLNQAINLEWINILVIEHQVRLREILGEIDELKIFSKDKKYLDPIPCSEYSAVFQLEILNINVEKICEPVLDVGCGSSAKLVHYLRAQGIKAYGIDRSIEKKSSYLIETDWFEFKMKPNYWGTIISHLSFTNHFKRNHFKKNGNHIIYARRYMDLLNSLKLGGSFFYTPDLAFIEQFLTSDLYDINKKKINNEKLSLMKRKNNMNIYSVQINKLNNN